jgi:hypothetical protein
MLYGQCSYLTHPILLYAEHHPIFLEILQIQEIFFRGDSALYGNRWG